MIQVARGKAIILPTEMPDRMKPDTRDRSPTGIHFEVRLWMEGKLTPSPRPMRARMIAIEPALRASGVIRVKNDHHSTPMLKIRFPP